jgi:hypothetical protein
VVPDRCVLQDDFVSFRELHRAKILEPVLSLPRLGGRREQEWRAQEPRAVEPQLAEPRAAREDAGVDGGDRRDAPAAHGKQQRLRSAAPMSQCCQVADVGRRMPAEALERPLRIADAILHVRHPVEAAGGNLVRLIAEAERRCHHEAV